MKSKLTLQINSLEALERLIGGDSETEMAIRDSVVVAFAEKHLKPIANSPKVKEMLDRLARNLEVEAIKTALGQVAEFKNRNWSGSEGDVKLRPEFVAAIGSAADLKTKAMTHQAIEDALAAWTPCKIAATIQQAIDYRVNDRIRLGVRAKLDEITKAVGA